MVIFNIFPYVYSVKPLLPYKGADKYFLLFQSVNPAS